ncbi:trehalase [Protopterus annectens]|uniref:trehalase n=1 Tax=Protopterus annectens TaxID=7888 RepID=UPI001CF9A0CB|nr:trehalase [Protopterus annectens]
MTFIVKQRTSCSATNHGGGKMLYQIYCTGEILKNVQLEKLYDDDKYFVDMKLKEHPDKVLETFMNMTSQTQNGRLTKEQLQQFVNSSFQEPGQEFETWIPTDWSENPTFLGKISDAKLKVWARELHELWKSLGRKIKEDVKIHSELYSQLYVPYPLVVPGGRFREYYYWDSYWIVNGLLLSEMYSTAKGMIENFLYHVERFGLIPNGGRIYYERRSQPPFLTLMMESYMNTKQDVEFLRKNIHLLEKEYEFWMKNRSVSVTVSESQYTLNQYAVKVDGPRPESYSDDVELAETVPEEQRQSLLMEIKSAAESGWDFSSRWFIDSSGVNRGTLMDTKTSHIIPVDLNAILCRVERVLASFHRILGNSDRAEYFQKALQNRTTAVNTVLWNNAQGIWFDYNLITNQSNAAFYASNIFPLWAKCYSDTDEFVEDKVAEYLQWSKALSYKNGIPTSLSESGQQWDYPNAWPPLQHVIIEGLDKSKSQKAKEIAVNLAQKWVRVNWEAYVKHKAMFEKYDVNEDGKPGGGGEYEVQLGFGWTNGVALQLLDQYGNQLTSGTAIRVPWIWTLISIPVLVYCL